MQYQIGAQLYTVRDQMNTGEEGVRDGLKKIAEMGYTTVQFSGINADVHFFKEECDKNGLTISATHYSFDRMKSELDKVIAEHKILGCNNIGIGCMPPEFERSEEGYKKLAAVCEDIAAKLKPYGMTLFYHHHRFEFEKYGDKNGLEILMENAPNLKFMPDVYWITASGMNPVNWLPRMNGRMCAVHLKDMTVRNDQSIMAEVGYGTLDMEAIIAAVKDCGVHIFLVEQDTCERDPYESLKMSIDYLKKTV